VSNTVGLRLGYARNDGAGFIDNVVNGEHGINGYNHRLLLIGYSGSPMRTFGSDSPLSGNGSKAITMRHGRARSKTLNTLFGDLTNEIFVNEPYTKNVGLVFRDADLNLGGLTSHRLQPTPIQGPTSASIVTLGLGQLRSS